MHLWKMLLSRSFSMVFVAFLVLCCCAGVVTSSKRHHRGRSAWRPFPLHQRKLTAQGRSASSFATTGSQAADIEARSDEGRGFMKMWKGMFPQQESNIIIITQPAPTTTETTSPTTTSPTTSGTTSSSAVGRDDDSVSGDQLVNTPIFNEPIAADTPSIPTNAYGRKNKANRRKAPQGKRNQNRNRRRRRNQKPRNRNRKRAEQIAQNIAKKPISSGNIFSLNGSGGGGGVSSGGLNANQRIQNIMNALRQQTPIVYNH